MKRKLKFAVLAVILLVAFGLYYLKLDFQKTAPTLYFNGNFITINDAQPKANAMLVENGIIKHIGELKDFSEKDLENVLKRDLQGATALPGFIDVHTHFALSMFLSEMHDLSGFTHPNNEAIWNSFEDIVKQTPKGEWIVCKGLDPVMTKDLQTPSIQYLDQIAPENPVVIFSQSLHNYWANSKAFEMVGITSKTPNPSSHSYYEHDAKGNLTGAIVEQEAFKPFIEKLKEDVLTSTMLSRAAQKVMRAYSQNGNTTIVSTGITINDKKSLLLFEHLSSKEPSLLGSLLEKLGFLPKREPTPRHFLYIRHDMAHLLPEKKLSNDFYNIIGIKHWYDGSPYTGSMYMNEPYLESDLTQNKLHITKNSKGKALTSKDSLKQFITTYHNNGWQMAFHAQGDAANSDIIEFFRSLNGTLDFSNSRHRLEHCLLLSKNDLPKLKTLNLTPSFHINHLYYYGDALSKDILAEDRSHAMLPLKSALDNGIVSSIHADQPMFESKPFRLIQTAVERKTSSGYVINEDERISLMDAIKTLTINAAWQIEMEDKLGSLETGKYADFIILDKDPFSVATENLDDIKCVETFINGNKVIY
ncbi:amidohydrolase [Mangrovimonas xylaniphaga]|uniref:amidohydrolase n=1 Tax=Mangrovimonas xylaniphaga TaxID=1645915 RepID=UPI0006B630B7|nr:amidohydrolase [Mangrovimonas xylaniphaga]